ncbi:MAG: 30S ribosomal protein S10 [Alphaproteobacteria bacterium]|nr:30S ribosomal protein S10 [Alphaproteobacteria bacterium]
MAGAKTKVSKKDGGSKLRLRVLAYEARVLDMTVRQIIETALRFDAKVVGPIPLATKIQKITLNRAAFIYKDAREQFEMRTHTRLIEIINPNHQVVEAVSNMSIPSGVSVEAQIV